MDKVASLGHRSPHAAAGLELLGHHLQGMGEKPELLGKTPRRHEASVQTPDGYPAGCLFFPVNAMRCLCEQVTAPQKAGGAGRQVGVTKLRLCGNHAEGTEKELTRGT